MTEGILAAADGDHELARDLAATFLDELADLLGKARAAAARADVAAVRQAAHSLKGSAATLGFVELAEAARSIEVDAREGRLEGEQLAAGMHRLEAAAERAGRATRSWLES